MSSLYFQAPLMLEALAKLQMAHKALVAYQDMLLGAGRGDDHERGHARSAHVLLREEAESALSRLEHALYQLDAAGGRPPSLNDPDVACWACRRGPEVNPDRDACVLGKGCRSAR